MNKKKITILIIIIMLGVGFAALAATLNINGNVVVNGNPSDFEVIYDTTYVKDKSKSRVNGLDYTIEDPVYNSNTSMTFSTTKGLLTKNDYYEVSYKLLNNSTMYDALVNITCGTSSDATGSLSPFTYSGNISNISITAQDSYEGKIRFTYETEVSTDTNISFTCKIVASAQSRSSIASTPTITTKTLTNYAFGTPTSASQTSYATVVSQAGYRVFAAVDNESNYYSCVYQETDEVPTCFQGGASASYEENKNKLLTEFASSTQCSETVANATTEASCSVGKYRCTVKQSGEVTCYDYNDSDYIGYCTISETGTVTCDEDDA